MPPTKSPKILKVAVPTPLYRLFDYRCPDGVRVAPGCRVRVPFGRREAIGVVFAEAAHSELAADRLKTVRSALDSEPLLGPDLLRLLAFASDYYLHPPGEVLAAALPPPLRRGRGVVETTVEIALAEAAADATLNRAPRQREALAALSEAGGVLPDRRLAERISGWARVRRALLERGLIVARDVVATGGAGAAADPRPGPPLNAQQRAAVSAVDSGPDKYAASLIDGVTGSGKTEVYLELIRRCLARGRQALVLVPEIGLTPQLVRRFRERLGVEPALLHSGVGDAARLDAWRRARAGDAAVVLGTRSAVFTPLAAPGLIVVDEEHDTSLSQQDGFRYSARDLAVVRARDAGIPLLLGTATPSLESLANVAAGRYRHLRLDRRAGGARPPAVRLIDLNRHPPDEGLSAPLREAIAAQLDAGGQALIYLNRRGFAPAMICTSCGAIELCRRCDARLTFHASRQALECHHCGQVRPLSPECSSCGKAVTPLGEGTERIEHVLKRHFPGEPLLRIDSDTTRGRDRFEAAFDEAVSGRARLLVGTQMLSKGHHFPELGLVGVLNADQGLFSSDFRAAERLAQSLIQVAGRAGRAERPGQVLIQTAFAQHPLLKTLVEEGYRGFAERALAERRATGWPPFSNLAVLRAEAGDRAAVWRYLSDVAGELRRLAGGCDVFGPVAAPMERRAGRYRAQLLLRAASRRSLRAALAPLRPRLDDHPGARRVRWSLDVDPVDLF